MNDKIAASILARLLAKGLLVGIWVPPQEVRELRGLVAQRKKMTGLATQAKNRLHAVLQRHHLVPPEGNPFHASQQSWWLALPLGALEQLSGFGIVTAITVWAAIGNIERFADPPHLVGYAGLGTRVHDSGMSTRTGRTLAPTLQVQVSPKRDAAICGWS